MKSIEGEVRKILNKVYDQGCYDTEPYGEREDDITIDTALSSILKLIEKGDNNDK